jgi:AAA ATPase domain
MAPDRPTVIAPAEELDIVVAGAVGGVGGVIVVEGPPATGKTRLLDDAVEAGRALGAQPLVTGATEPEPAFGVARRLLEPAMEELDALERRDVLEGAAGLASPLIASRPPDAPPPAPQDVSLIHGLYWLAANLADRQPLVLALDDAHWADLPSLRLCLYLAQSIDELPIALVITTRPDTPDPPGRLLRAVATSGHARALRLAG